MRLVMGMLALVFVTLLTQGALNDRNSCLRQQAPRENQLEIVRPFLLEAARARQANADESPFPSREWANNWIAASRYNIYATRISETRELDCSLPFPDVR